MNTFYPYTMPDFNTTNFTNPSYFILLGIPGLEAFHVWISIPFCAMYTIAILGNSAILWIVWMEPSLHAPMYYFLCMLAAIDLVLSTSFVPKMLSIFWFNSREIDFTACLTQLFFIHSFSMMDGGTIVALAFDRYVAICDPLRYSTILTNSVVAKIGLAVLLRGCLLILPEPFLARWWPYCRTNVVTYTYCETIALSKMACANGHIINYYSYILVLTVVGPDVSFIAFSYIQILRAIFSLPTKEARRKTFATCSSHLSVVVAFYVSVLFSWLTEVVGEHVSLHFHIITSNLHLLVLPMLNPIIYGVRTKQIWERLLQLFPHKVI